jgi:membrane-associated phospholipid phosphatase
MRRIIILTALAWSMIASVSAQQKIDTPVFSIHPAVDFPVVAAAVAWDVYGFSQISKKAPSGQAEVMALKTSDIDWLDRWAVHPYSKRADQLSYVPFYVAIPLPLIVFAIDNKMRKDYWRLTLLYGEAMTLTGVLYTSAVHYVNRHRPLVYESASPLGKRLSPNSRNSFFAGHVALVGTSAFFIAGAYAAEHPESKAKWAFYGGAEAITALTAYLRNRAGEHFFTDITLGNLVGAASGLLVPLLHQHVKTGQHPLSILPFTTTHGTGFTMLYRFG